MVAIGRDSLLENEGLAFSDETVSDFKKVRVCPQKQ